MRNLKLIKKYEKFGLYIPKTFREHQKNWYSNGNKGCDYCVQDNVSIMDHGDTSICYKCYITNWKKHYRYDPTICKNHWDLFQQFLKEEKKGK